MSEDIQSVQNKIYDYLKNKNQLEEVDATLIDELMLEMDFIECEHRAGEFVVPVVPPGRPKSSKVKVKDPGARLKALKFHHLLNSNSYPHSL